MKLLVDTSAVLALAMRQDRNHRAAVEFLRSHAHARLVLTELVVSEVATRLRALADAKRAAALARSFLDSRRYELVFVDGELLRAGIGRMEQFADKRLSLTDCISFVVMQEQGIEPNQVQDRLPVTPFGSGDQDDRALPMNREAKQKCPASPQLGKENTGIDRALQ